MHVPALDVGYTLLSCNKSLLLDTDTMPTLRLATVHVRNKSRDKPCLTSTATDNNRTARVDKGEESGSLSTVKEQD